MKKIVLIILALLSLFGVYTDVKAKENIRIPKNAIRFRVLANSNSPRDQKIKSNVASKMQKELYFLLKNSKTKKEARNLIKSDMNNFNNILQEQLQDESYSYKINYGMNYFPVKNYKGVTYDEGYYESLLVTLGKGEGDNWWCVLFPPFCLLEAEEDSNSTKVEYKSFIKDIIKKYFK